MVNQLLFGLRCLGYTAVVGIMSPGVVTLTETAAMAQTTEIVSISTNGQQGDDISGRFTGPAISSDGRIVAFDSQATNLVSGDTNLVTDVFVRDRVTGVTE